MALPQDEFFAEQEDTLRGRFLTFAIEEQVFGIQIRHVKEIVGLQPITKLPELPEYIKGIINLRSKIIPLLDVRLKFGKDALEYNDRTCIIVVETSGISAGLIVDNVVEVLAVDEENIVPPPDMQTGSTNKYISGIGKANGGIKLLLDCEELFRGEENPMKIEMN